MQYGEVCQRIDDREMYLKKVREKMKKKILMYAHYYVPDVASTGQLLQEIAEGMSHMFDVTVICTVPSYGGKILPDYRTRKYYWEIINGVKVLRIRVSEFDKTNKLSRIRNILDYYVGAIMVTRKLGKQDYIFAVSQPPVLGGLIGTFGKWVNHSTNRFSKRNKKTTKFIYQIQDFNPEQIEAVGYFGCRPILWLLKRIDNFSIRNADLVITVGRDMVDTLKKRFQNDKKHMPEVALINNWIDEKNIFPLNEDDERVKKFKNQYGLGEKFVIAYSGNLGHYYDLMELLKVIKKFEPDTLVADGRKVVFAFIGSGSLLNSMKEYVSEQNMTNVIFIPYQDKSNLIYSLNAADVHWCVNVKGIKGVSCPSKYYGIAAVGKPVLGVLERGTEIRCIIEEIRGGLVCEPGDYKKVEENIKWFIDHAQKDELTNMGKRNREYLVKNLSRDKSIEKYINEITKL